ncbi:hypothetical protein DND47_26280 [Pseudomonas syringae pv. syringae]|nr:hypothetical protein DND47_26280 [Pseudomonas syringae pv. syringae]
MELLARDASLNHILIFCQVGFVARIPLNNYEVMKNAVASCRAYFPYALNTTHTQPVFRLLAETYL